MASIPIRPAEDADLDPLARLWHDGWQDGHRAGLPERIRRDRTLASFRARLKEHWARLRVLGPVGDPLGFSLIKGSELDQFYLAPAARGTGLAAVLMNDAEAIMAAAGVTTASLVCAIGNDRAARFYEKAGWRNTGVRGVTFDLDDGPCALDIWWFEKTLSPPSPG